MIISIDFEVLPVLMEDGIENENLALKIWNATFYNPQVLLSHFLYLILIRELAAPHSASATCDFFVIWLGTFFLI